MQAARDSRGILFGDSWPRREGVEREGEREREREAGREDRWAEPELRYKRNAGVWRSVARWPWFKSRGATVAFQWPNKSPEISSHLIPIESNHRIHQ